MSVVGDLPGATVGRLPVYLRSLAELAAGGVTTVSSDRLAANAGVNAAKVRKDLSYLGTYGTRGVGYDVEYLRFHISQALGVANTWPVVVVGVGNLGRALAGHREFLRRGFPVVAAFDVDPAKFGTSVKGVPVKPIDDLAECVTSMGVAIGVIATPAEAAQDVADQLVAAGVQSILSFAPKVITVPDGVSVRDVDMVSELQILGFHLHQALPESFVPPEAV